MRGWLHDRGRFGGEGGQTAFLVFNAGIILVSVLAGFGLIGGPELLRISLAFYALFMIPGVALSGLVLGASMTPLQRISSIFAMGLCFVSAILCFGFIPGISYAAISFAGAVLTMALLVIERVKRLRRRENKPGLCRTDLGANYANARGARSVLFWVALFALCFFVFYGSGELGPRTDSLDHVSFVRRSVESNHLFPRDSFYREGDGASFDMRKGLWHPVLSLWTYRSHAEADHVWRAVPSFVAFFALCAFLLFALELCGSRLSAAVSVGFFLLLYNADGVAWLTKLGYSRNISHVLLWIDLAFLLTYFRSEERKYVLATVLIACIGAAYHAVFALLLGASLLALSIYVTFLREGRKWRPAFWRSVPAQLAAMAVPLAVRAGTAFAGSNPIHVHRQGMLVFSPSLAIVDPAELLMSAGIAFFFAVLMAPFFFLITSRGGKRSLVFMLFLVPVFLVLNPITDSFMERRIGYLHCRILDAAPLMVFLALVVLSLIGILVFGRPSGRTAALKRDIRLSWSGVAARSAAACALALFLFYPFRASVHQLGETARKIVSRAKGTSSQHAALVAALNERIPDHSVIVSDPLTSYVLSAYTNHFVVVTLDQHGSPVDTSAFERIREVRNLLSPAVPLAASRAWLDKERADYVLLDMCFPDDPDFFAAAMPGSSRLTLEKFLACPGLLSDVLDLDGFRLFEVHGESPELRGDSACTVPRSVALSCENETSDEREDERLIVDSALDVGCGVVLARLTIDSYAFHPGDTLKGHFCWQATQPVAFGLPLDVVIRIDTEYPKGAWYRECYSKQYRRIIERRSSRFYRDTWVERLVSGFTYPDQWEPGRIVRQDISLPLSAGMVPGDYEVHIKVIRRPYLMNRSLSDYLSNNDSLEGVAVAEIVIEGRPSR